MTEYRITKEEFQQGRATGIRLFLEKPEHSANKDFRVLYRNQMIEFILTARDRRYIKKQLKKDTVQVVIARYIFQFTAANNIIFRDMRIFCSIWHVRRMAKLLEDYIIAVILNCEEVDKHTTP